MYVEIKSINEENKKYNPSLRWKVRVHGPAYYPFNISFATEEDPILLIPSSQAWQTKSVPHSSSF